MVLYQKKLALLLICMPVMMMGSQQCYIEAFRQEISKINEEKKALREECFLLYRDYRCAYKRFEDEKMDRVKAENQVALLQNPDNSPCTKEVVESHLKNLDRQKRFYNGVSSFCSSKKPFFAGMGIVGLPQVPWRQIPGGCASVCTDKVFPLVSEFAGAAKENAKDGFVHGTKHVKKIVPHIVGGVKNVGGKAGNLVENNQTSLYAATGVLLGFDGLRRPGTLGFLECATGLFTGGIAVSRYANPEDNIATRKVAAIGCGALAAAGVIKGAQGFWQNRQNRNLARVQASVPPVAPAAPVVNNQASAAPAAPVVNNQAPAAPVIPAVNSQASAAPVAPGDITKLEDVSRMVLSLT